MVSPSKPTLSTLLVNGEFPEAELARMREVSPLQVFLLSFVGVRPGVLQPRQVCRGAGGSALRGQRFVLSRVHGIP
jgi:hypothetical protein